ncbi:hypothetical protein [Duganella sp. Root198D2]|uniref:hypothetical protein n=1 Tax=Duganella sp. Root198D2 TaxID=1736489 RepID=UPI00070E6D35|nr:hypothetical protein [Duganella sp. Root198D2]KRB83573.1 hypothetical protein ASE26_10375 [Duganella sp. Root198D2]
MNVRDQLLALFLSLAVMGTGHAAPMDEAVLKQLLPGQSHCDDARNDPKFQKMDVDFDQYCVCLPIKAEEFLRAADWRSPGDPTAEDKAKYSDLIRDAEVVCARPYVKKQVGQQLEEICRGGRGIFAPLARQGTAALDAACPCIASTATDQTYGAGDAPIDPNINTKAVLVAAINSCAPKQGGK